MPKASSLTPLGRRSTRPSKMSAPYTATISASSAPCSSTSTLSAALDSVLVEFGHAKSTNETYRAYVQRGLTWITNHSAERRAENVQDGIDTDLFETSFSNPNKCSPLALQLYITQKCITERNGVSTATGIHAAFADFWSRMDYSGDTYRYNEDRDMVEGCPAQADGVIRLIDAIKNRAKVNGDNASRNHAEAYDIEAMKQTIRWSESQYPLSALDYPPKDDTEKALALKHARGRAMFSMGFNVWLRNFELSGLRVRHITRGCIGNGPQYHPYLKVFVEDRKGHQNKADDGPLECNEYKIYRQDIPEIDLFTQLSIYMDYLERVVGRPLKADEFLFPYIGSNGAIHLNREMSHAMVQKMITEFSSGAGLGKHYSTHCFRRGGAQYRFMFAPKRWGLKTVRWWGGWAKGESVDTLMRYLLDSLNRYEESFADQLCPSGSPDAEAATIEYGGHRATAQQTLSFNGFTSTIPGVYPNVFSHPSARLYDPRNHSRNSLHFDSTGFFPPYGPAYHNHSLSPVPMPIYPVPTFHCTPSTAPLVVPSHFAYPSSIILPNTIGGHAIGGLTVNRGFLNLAPQTSSPASTKELPVSLASIPDLGHVAKRAWRKAMNQWDQVDPQTGIALKDWPNEWYTGAMRTKFAVKRQRRQVVWKERERLGGTNKKFLAEHPYANSIPFTELVERINIKNGILRRVRKSGPQP